MHRSLDDFAREMTNFMPRYIREASARVISASLKGDITISQIIILNIIKSADQCKMKDIAKALHVSTSAATGSVDRMVRIGLLKRRPSEKDRRVINIEMTQKGMKIIDDIQSRRYKFIIDIFGKFKPEERERFLDTMKKIYSILRGEKNEAH